LPQQIKAISWKNTLQGLYVISASGKATVQCWEAGDNKRLRLLWAMNQEAIMTRGAVIEGANGLDDATKKLFPANTDSARSTLTSGYSNWRINKSLQAEMKQPSSAISKPHSVNQLISKFQSPPIDNPKPPTAAPITVVDVKKTNRYQQFAAQLDQQIKTGGVHFSFTDQPRPL
jgi:hypothetical protein